MSRRLLWPVSVALNLFLLAALVVPLRFSGAQSADHYFPETHHWVRGQFWQYWQNHGGLSQQGYPLTEEFQEKNKLNGQTYTVQYFERAIFEKHPENKPPFDVLLSQLGKFEVDARYPNNSNPAAAPVPGPGVGPTPTTPPAPTQPPAGGQQFHGHGDQATPAFALHAGLVVIHSAETSGTGNFSVELLDGNGKFVALAANLIGGGDVSAATNVPLAGQYALQVGADSDWTITVSQPTASYSTPPATQNWQGHLSQATSLFSLKAGAARFHAVGTGGSSNFSVELLDGNGNFTELIANQIGGGDVSKLVNIPSNGTYILVVDWDGNWTVGVQQ